MDENRRSGNNGDISAAYGDDTAELLNEKKAEELLAGPAMLSAGSSRLKAGKSAAAGSDTSGGKPRGRRRPDSEKSAVELNADKPEVKKSAPKRSSSARAAAADADGGVKAKSGSGKSARKKPNSEKPSVESADEKSAANKKRVSKKVAAEKTAAKAASERESAVVDELDQAGEDRAGHGSCKTPQVMKLIENDNDNLVLFAGKSRVPNLLRGRESLSRITRRSAAEDETEVVNITELVINHEAVEILDRFNACSCEKCVKIFSGIIAQRIPVRYARISRSELESGELPERAASMRKVVLPEMIRELICNKKRCFHDK